MMPYASVDTDQLVPARFLKTTTKKGLGKILFSDLRFDNKGNPVSEFPLNQSDAHEKKIMITGPNFGCGSSREHAPWALLDFGIEAIIGTSFGDIFATNALKNGLLIIKIPPEEHQLISKAENELITIDLENQTINFNDKIIEFEIDPFAKKCLVAGEDALDYLLKHKDDIKQYEKNRRQESTYE